MRAAGRLWGVPMPVESERSHQIDARGMLAEGGPRRAIFCAVVDLGAGHTFDTVSSMCRVVVREEYRLVPAKVTFETDRWYAPRWANRVGCLCNPAHLAWGISPG